MYFPVCDAQNADKFNSVQLINVSFIKYIDVLKLSKNFKYFAVSIQPGGIYPYRCECMNVLLQLHLS